MFKEIFICATVLAMSWATPFYRKDYKYIEEFDAFYKVHWDTDGVSWDSALIACEDEGAQLFYPKEKNEWVIVKNLSAMLPGIQNTTDVIVGIHDEVGLGEFITIDGQSTPNPLLSGEEQTIVEGDCVIMDLVTGAYKFEPCATDPLTKRLFVCKKVDERPCPTIDQAYIYAKETKKCFKVNNREKTWQEAWHTCFMEGGLLAMPESKTEVEIIYSLVSKDFPTYFVGFRKIFPGSSYYTVKGKKLDELHEQVYYNWYNFNNDQLQNDCGAASYSYSNVVSFKSVVCHDRLPFICEMKSKV